MIHALKCQKFDYLKIWKNVQIEYKKNAFSMYHLGQIFIFFHWLLFSRNIWMELKRMPLSIRNSSNFS